MHGVPAPAPRRSARIGVHVNRREALKKLAAGGAIAAGGSLVLSSNAVAATASGPPITGIPGPGEELTNFVTFSNQGDVTFTHVAGRLLALAIQGQSERSDGCASLPHYPCLDVCSVFHSRRWAPGTTH